MRETREDGERKETYVRGGRRFQRSQIDVLYDQYKFFTVETEVIY